MADFKQNRKDAEAYYETQLKIAEVIKEQTDTWSSYTNAQKQGVKNAKEMKQIQGELAKLTNATTAEEKAKKAELEKQLQYLKEYNKQLLSTKTAVQAVTKNIAKWGMDKLNALGGNLLDQYDKMERATRQAAINQGMSVTRMHQFRKTAQDANIVLANLGFENEATAEMMVAMNEETGRQIMLSKQAAIQMGEISKRTGISHQEIAGMVGQMESFGMSTESSAQMLEGIEDMSNKMGVNTQKVLKKVQGSLKLVNKLSFKGGVKGMAKMAAYSEKYKLEMEEVAGFAEQVFRPEGAIDAAANLQVLGGSLAKLGDPFQLMYQARNAPEELAKSITKAAAETAVFNEATGEFEVSAYELDRLKEAGAATGMSLESLVKTAKQTAKMNMFDEALKVDPKSEGGQFLSTIAQMGSQGAFIEVDGNKTYLADLSATEQEALANKLKAEEAAEAKRQEDIQSTQERVMNQQKVINATLIKAMAKFDDAIRGPLMKFLKGMVKTFLDNPWIAKLVVALAGFAMIAKILGPILAPVAWYLKGMWMSKGFSAGMKKNKIAEQLTGGTGGKQGKFYKGGQFMKGGGRAPKGGAFAGGSQGAAGTQAMGESAGGQSKNFLKGAVALLAISAALFVFAKALQEFEKLQNGWGTLVLAAGSLMVLGLALKFMGPTLKQFGNQSWAGIAAMVALSAAVLGLGYATTLFAQGGFAGTMLMILALAALTIAIVVLGALGMSGIGFIGVALILALAVAMIALGYATKLIAEGIAIVVNSFTNLFGLVNMDNVGALMLMGPALLSVSLGIMALSVSLIALGAAMLLGGFLGLIGLSETADNIQKAFGDIDPAAVAEAVTSINNVDMEKVAAIKELANAMSLWSLFGGGINVDMELDVGGTIDIRGEAGGSKSTEWVEDPIFVSKLKDIVWEAMEKGRGGGKP